MDADSPTSPPYEAFYIESMLFNSTSAVRSILRLEAVFGKLPDNPTIADVEHLPTKLILNELQNMIVHAGALSRYFWPVRPDHKPRGKLLSKYFAMAEDSPLFNRDLRNAIEHFDERIDRYFSQGAVGYFFPEYVGPKPQEDGVPGHFFRAFFVDTGEFRLLDEEFLIEPVADEILFVHAHLEKMHTEGGRFQVAERNT
ncbi:hypothetical protein [Thioalkalivibrio thiocyanoxidans]|uniref:hypothetical protein n=1 Tax=Thioalkalivibrio thiocyanoxidans TaxID=152475 RepID=UPI00037FA7E0|nr:hypothetical protein [Thioalkalivibrio thiocyanoxidans]